jgi:hypothetical protein
MERMDQSQAGARLFSSLRVRLLSNFLPKPALSTEAAFAEFAHRHIFKIGKSGDQVLLIVCEVGPLADLH